MVYSRSSIFSIISASGTYEGSSLSEKSYIASSSSSSDSSYYDSAWTSMGVSSSIIISPTFSSSFSLTSGLSADFLKSLSNSP